jgi:hypothetical protein
MNLSPRHLIKLLEEIDLFLSDRKDLTDYIIIQLTTKPQ